MKWLHQGKKPLLFIALLMLWGAAGGQAQATAAATPMTAKTLSDTMADNIIQRYQPSIDAMTGHGWDHSNSVILHGMEKRYLKTKNPAHFAYIKTFVDDYVNADGSVKGLLNTLDGIHPGVLCLFMYEQTGEQRYLRAAKTMRDHLLGSGAKKPAIRQSPAGTFWHKDEEKYRDVSSVDGIYMAHPFLLRYGLLAKDDEAIKVALTQTLLISEKSFDAKIGLPYHAWDYSKQRPWANPNTGQSTLFWSRASGWYAMALVDMLEVLPKDHQDYPRMLHYYRQVATGLVRWQEPQSGLWFQVVDQAQRQGNYPEMAGSGMIVYALAKGARLKLLDDNARAAAQKAWLGMQQFIQPYKDGGLQIQSIAPGMSVQNDYAAYVAIRPVTLPSEEPKQHAHGYMSVLLAGAEME